MKITTSQLIKIVYYLTMLTAGEHVNESGVDKVNDLLNELIEIQE